MYRIRKVTYHSITSPSSLVKTLVHFNPSIFISFRFCVANALRFSVHLKLDFLQFSGSGNRFTEVVTRRRSGTMGTGIGDSSLTNMGSGGAGFRALPVIIDLGVGEGTACVTGVAFCPLESAL